MAAVEHRLRLTGSAGAQVLLVGDHFGSIVKVHDVSGRMPTDYRSFSHLLSELCEDGYKTEQYKRNRSES